MSLRLRLLLAVGAVALLALVVADAATYRFLERSLISRVDASLQAVDRGVNGPRPFDRGGGPRFGPRGGGGKGSGGRGRGGFSTEDYRDSPRQPREPRW